MTERDVIEVLHSNGPRLAKAWRQDGQIQTYEGARNYRREAAMVSSIGELHSLLQRLEPIPTACIIRGRYVGDALAAEVTARLPEYEDRSDGTRLPGRPDHGFLFRRKSYFEDQPLHVAMFDVEDTHTETDPLADPEGACREWIRANLPTAFHEVSFSWQLSNSFGHPSKTGLRAHLWFWLSQPRTSATLKAWAKQTQLAVDHSVFNPVQVHYTAGPMFESGIRDPVTKRSGFYQSFIADEVMIMDIPESAEPEPAPTVGTDEAPRTGITEEQLADLKSALSHQLMLDAGGEEEFAVKQVLYPLLSLGSLGQELWFEYCAKAADNSEHPDPDWPRKTWEIHRDSAPPLSDFLSVYKTAAELGWQNPFKRHVADTQELLSMPGPDPLDIENAPTPEKPTIRITGGKLPEIAREAEKLLSPHLFTRGGKLVCVSEASELGDTIDRVSEQRVIMSVTSEYVRRELTDLANIEKFSQVRGRWEPTDCPKDLANNVFEHGSWPTIRPLSALRVAPFVRADKSICTTPGYDGRSQALYIPNAAFPELSEHLSRQEAEAALDTLLEPFKEFPYSTSSAKSAFAAHILTEAARLAIDSCPMFWYTTGLRGTGKTLLSAMPATIVHGVKPAMRPWVGESEEMRKNLLASLLAGDSSIAFDNVPSGQKTRSVALCTFLTSGSTYQDRRLGVSEMMKVSNFAVVSTSGNNITPADDLARRSLVIRLDANMTAKQLQTRTFKIEDLREHVLEHRVKLLMAALTIIRAHQQSGHRGPTALPSFEKWSRIVRDPLLWLGMADPVETQDDETEDDSDGLTEAFDLLGTTFAGQWFSAADIVSKVGSFGDTDGKIARTLQEAGCADAMSVQKISYWLRDHRDKIVANFKLERHSSKSNNTAVRFRFKQLGSSAVNDESATLVQVSGDNRDLL